MVEPAAASCQDVVGSGEAGGDISRRAAAKQQAKLQKLLATEFQEQLAGSMATLEERMQQGSAAEKARARDRRLELRAVLRGVTEPGASAEERLRLLQTKYAQAVQEQARHDAEVLALQEQLAAATKDGETAHRELAHALSKADCMARLSRSLQEQNKLLTKQMTEQKQTHDRIQEQLQVIQGNIESQNDKSAGILDHNRRLTEENAQLSIKLKEVLGLLDRSQQQLQDVAEYKQKLLAEQAAVIKSTQAHISSFEEQHQVLSLKAAMAEQLQATIGSLEALNAMYKQQAEEANAKLLNQGATLTQASAAMKSFTKLKAQMDADLALLPRVLAERDALKQQLREQACELKRLQQQRQRLEGLCRAMQQRRAGAPPDAGLLAFTAAGSEAAGGDGSSSNGGGVSSEASGDVLPEVSQLVRAAVAAVVSAAALEQTA